MSLAGTGPADRAIISFDGRQVCVLRDKDKNQTIKARSEPAVIELNILWNRRRPVAFRVVRSERRNARIETDAGDVIMKILPQDAGKQDTMVVARDWASKIQEAFDAHAAGAE